MQNATEENIPSHTRFVSVGKLMGQRKTNLKFKKLHLCCTVG
jgi:hypothetical protein